MIKSGNGSLSESETLRQAMDCGILNLEGASCEISIADFP